MKALTLLSRLSGPDIAAMPVSDTATRLTTSTPRSRLHYALAALFFTLLVLALNYPLVLNLGTHIVDYSYGDTFEVLWQLSAVQRALFETHSNPFYNPGVFYPQGYHMASGGYPIWYFALLSPLTAAMGPVVTFNLVTLATFIVGGLGVYWLAHGMTGKTAAALIAGCAYLVAPVFTMRLGGHVNVLLGMMFLPYAAGAMLRAMTLDGPRAWRWVVGGGLLLAATILSTWYYLFMATIPLVTLGLTTPSAGGLRPRLLRLAALGAVTLALLTPALWLTWQARQVMLPGGGTFELSSAERKGFSPDYLIAPNPLHPLWRDRAGSLFPVAGEWDIVALGYAALALAALGLLTTPWRETRPWVAMGLISFVLGLGPWLRWRGERVELPVPPRLAAALAPLLRDVKRLPVGTVPVLLPDFVLYYVVPFYSSMRVWARFAVPLTLVVAVGVGFGAAWLLGKGRTGRAVAVLLGVLVVFEGLTAPYKVFTPVAINERTVNAWLAAQPAATVIIEYPLPWVNTLALYSQGQHRRNVVNGHMSFTPTFLAEAKAQLGEWPNAAALPLLRQWNVEYVVVTGSQADADFRDVVWPTITAIDGLCPVISFPDAFGLEGDNHTFVFAVGEPGVACPPAKP